MNTGIGPGPWFLITYRCKHINNNMHAYVLYAQLHHNLDANNILCLVTKHRCISPGGGKRGGEGRGGGSYAFVICILL